MSRPSVGGRLAGRYEIRSVIADRPTGMLYRGFDEQIGVEVALRLIDAELLVDDEERRSFVQRAVRARPLQHPNLMRLYDALIDEDTVVLVMQWAPGDRLARRLREGRAPDREEARRILRRAAAGIAHAHQHGIVLGNVRPDTVILYPEGLKLTNVGIGPALPRARFLAAMQRHGEDQGLAPELVAGNPVDARTDVYALAVLARTLFSALDGAPSAAIAPVLARALVEDPALRPRDAEAFVRELEAALDGRMPTRSISSMSTVRDTEPVPRIPSASLGQLTRPEVRRAGAGKTALDASVSAAGDAHEADVTGRHSREEPETVVRPRPGGSGVVELELEELVEVEAPRAPPTAVAPAPAEIVRALPAQHARPPSIEPELSLPVEEATRPVVKTPAAPLRVVRPLYEEESATTRVEKISIDHGPPMVAPPPAIAQSLPEALRAQPDYAQADRHGRALLFLVVAAMSIGIFGGGALWRFASATHTTPTVTVVTVPAPVPAPAPAPPPAPIPAPAAKLPTQPAAVTQTTWTGACPLGMAHLTSPHAYCIDQYEYPGGHTMPRTHVSVADAEHVCESRGLRLCSDPEWENACRGPGAASYPYGQSFDGSRCNVAGHGGVIEEAGSRPHCRSGAGAFDMSGNVAEWTQNGNQRGGSARSPTTDTRCSHVVRGADASGADDVGFRCCAAAH
jgi:hypothetical protein